MQVNRQQCCSIFGLTRAEFDRLTPLGFPARKKSSSRGQDWVIDTVEALAWMLEQEAAKARPRGTPAKPDFSTAPRGWEAVRACEALDRPGQRVAMITALGIVYGLPRLVANSASDLDLPVDKAWHLSAGLVMAVLELARMQVPGWPQDDG